MGCTRKNGRCAIALKLLARLHPRRYRSSIHPMPPELVDLFFCGVLIGDAEPPNVPQGGGGFLGGAVGS